MSSEFPKFTFSLKTNRASSPIGKCLELRIRFRVLSHYTCRHADSACEVLFFYSNLFFGWLVDTFHLNLVTIGLSWYDTPLCGSVQSASKTRSSERTGTHSNQQLRLSSFESLSGFFFCPKIASSKLQGTTITRGCYEWFSQHWKQKLLDWNRLNWAISTM